jgi:hypothetical protein
MEATEESNDDPHTLRPHCTGEKVRGQQYIHVDTDEFPPGHGLLTFWGGWQTMALEDISYGLIADRIAQVGQSPHNPIIAPRAILSGHPHHESFEVVANAGTSNRLTRLCTVTLLGGKLAVPSQDGVGPDNRHDLLEGLLAQLLAKLGGGLTVAISQLHATSDLLTEHAIFCDQVRIAQPELFVNRRSDRPEQLLPVHTSHTPTKTPCVDDQYGRKHYEIQVEA